MNCGFHWVYTAWLVLSRYWTKVDSNYDGYPDRQLAG